MCSIMPELLHDCQHALLATNRGQDRGNREDENGEASSNQDENDAILSGSAIVKLESTS